MKGQEMVAGELSPEVSPVIVVEDNSAELQFLQGVRLCTSVMAQPAVASQTSLFRIRNPAASGVIATVTYLSMTANITITLNVGYGATQTELGTVGATAVRDGRWSRPTNPTALIASRANNVAINLQSSLWVARFLQDTMVQFKESFVLLPGESIELGSPSNNVALQTAIYWAERQLPALEQ